MNSYWIGWLENQIHWMINQIVLSEAFLTNVNNQHITITQPLTPTASKKCIVVNLDDTLWFRSTIVGGIFYYTWRQFD